MRRVPPNRQYARVCKHVPCHRRVPDFAGSGGVTVPFSVRGMGRLTHRKLGLLAHPARVYWWRKATIGSTRMARNAGMNEAKSATAQSRMATEENVRASVLVTPSNMLFK